MDLIKIISDISVNGEGFLRGNKELFFVFLPKANFQFSIFNFQFSISNMDTQWTFSKCCFAPLRKLTRVWQKWWLRVLQQIQLLCHSRVRFLTNEASLEIVHRESIIFNFHLHFVQLTLWQTLGLSAARWWLKTSFHPLAFVLLAPFSRFGTLANDKLQ